MKYIVAGIGTGVGKTVVSAILTKLLDGIYWKPIECGLSDSKEVKGLIENPILPPAFSFKAPLSPHAAASLENKKIDKITPPETKGPLIIESVGGIMVPISLQETTLELFAPWEAKWILVARNYLGCINHTLLAISELKRRNVSLLGLIFNGENNASLEAICSLGRIPLLAKLDEEKEISSIHISKYCQKWQRDVFLK